MSGPVEDGSTEVDWVCLQCGAPKTPLRVGAPCPVGCGSRTACTPKLQAALVAHDAIPDPHSTGVPADHSELPLTRWRALLRPLFPSTRRPEEHS